MPWIKLDDQFYDHPKTVLFQDWLETQLEDPEFRKAYEELEPAYQIARLRILQGLTQEELAERAGTGRRGAGTGTLAVAGAVACSCLVLF